MDICNVTLFWVGLLGTKSFSALQRVLNNGTAYIHTYFAKSGLPIDPNQEGYDRFWSFGRISRRYWDEALRLWGDLHRRLGLGEVLGPSRARGGQTMRIQLVSPRVDPQVMRRYVRHVPTFF